MFPLFLALTATASAEEPSYMDLFSGSTQPPQPGATARPNRPTEVRPPLQPNPAPNQPPELVAEPEPEVAAAEPVESVACVEAPLVAQEAQEAPSSPISVSAGLGVHSHYMFRGANYFGVGQRAPGVLISPSLTAEAGPVSFGWWSAFQGTGADRDAIVKAGSGHEQDLWVAYTHGLGDRASVSAGLYSYTYLGGTKKEAGAATPFWLEPNVGLSLDLGVSVDLYAAWTQGVQSGIAGLSYGYVNGAIGHSVPVGGGVTTDLGAALGAKAMVDPSQWTGNVFDASLMWGFTWSNDAISISPAGHLSWTDLPSVSLGQETTLWFGVETGVSL